jgi:hypothetical protein
MSTQPPFPEPIPPAAQLAQPGLSEPSRIINTFIAPRKTFEDLKIKTRWWAPWILTSIFILLFGFVAVQKVDMVRFTRQQIEQSKFAQRQMEQLSPEQQEQQIRIRAMGTKVVFFVFPIITFIGGLLIAAILMGVFNFGFAAEVPYGRALAIVFYSFVPRIIFAVLLIVSLLASADPNTIDISTNPMPTNPGFFMDPQGSKFLYGLASGLDLFALWVVALLGFGFSAASPNRKLKPGTAITTVMVLYGILVLAGAALKAAF